MGEGKDEPGDAENRCEDDQGVHDTAQPYFAKRRPDWEPQQLHHGLHLASFSEMKATSRKACPVCGKSRSWYCPDCVCSLFPQQQPRVELPFEVRIITHPEEKRTKSTGLQAKLLCPEFVELIDFDQVDSACLNTTTSALLFPSTDAAVPTDLNIADLKTVYIIDRCASRRKVCLLHDLV
jgi:hypothetical protein